MLTTYVIFVDSSYVCVSTGKYTLSSSVDDASCFDSPSKAQYVIDRYRITGAEIVKLSVED